MEDFKPWMNKRKTKVVYQGMGNQVLDLSGLAEFPNITRLGVYEARRVKLPQGHDWSRVRTLEFSWQPQWAEVLEQRSATSIYIVRPTQETFDSCNYEIPVDEEGISGFSVSTIKDGSVDSWFQPAFRASWVKIINSRRIDLSTAGAFDSIGLLEFRYVTRLAGLSHFTRQGRVRAIRLENPLILDPQEFWNIEADFVQFGTGRKENDAWLEEVWEQRPANWEEKFFINSRFMDKKLGRKNWEETAYLARLADEKAIRYRFAAAVDG